MSSLYAYYGKGSTMQAAFSDTSGSGDVIYTGGLWQEIPLAGGSTVADGWYRTRTGSTYQTSDYVLVSSSGTLLVVYINGEEQVPVNRTAVTFYGYSADSKAAAFAAATTEQTYYLDDNDYMLYTTSTGSTLAPAGWYMEIQGASVELSLFTYYNGSAPEEPTTEPVTNDPSEPVTDAPPPPGATQFDAFFTLQVGTQSIVVKGSIYAELKELAGNYYCRIAKSMICYPDSRCTRLSVYTDSSMETLAGFLTMKPSRSYNYSYVAREDGKAYIEIPLNNGSSPAATTRIYREEDVVIASEASMPYFFPVQHSYRVQGRIVDLAVMAEQITDSQTGQWPLFVLTESGIFALEQGSGVVLYGRTTPISSDRCKAGSSQTGAGVAFITERGIHIIEGRTAVNISLPLLDKADKTIRSNPSFLLATKSEALYDISASLSQVDFEEYIKGCRILYDSTRSEVIITNTSYKYSYVYSLTSHTWHKITTTFRQGSGKIALQYSKVVSLSEEVSTEQVTHIQTRPLALSSYGYKTLYRAILRGLIRPATGKIYGYYLFGSNDLAEWNIIVGRQISINVANIRTTRSSKSFRYYIIVAGGHVKGEHNIAGVELMLEDKLDSKVR